MKTGFLTLILVLASSTAFAGGINSLCEVKVKRVVVQKLQILDGASQGSVDNLDITVLFNDDTGRSAQVGIDDKSAGTTTTFYAATSAPGTFAFAVMHSRSGKTYSLMCTKL